MTVRGHGRPIPSFDLFQTACHAVIPVGAFMIICMLDKTQITYQSQIEAQRQRAYTRTIAWVLSFIHYLITFTGIYPFPRPHVCFTCVVLILPLWWELLLWGLVMVYPSWSDSINSPSRNRSQQVIGHATVAVCTFGAFIPYRMIELICDHWNSPVEWKRHFSQTIGGLVVFKVWYEIAVCGYRLAYEKHEQTTLNPEVTVMKPYPIIHQMLGRAMLIMVSFGLFPFFQIVATPIRFLMNSCHQKRD